MWHGGGPTPILLYHVYGPGDTAAGREWVDAALQSCLEDSKGRGNFPTLLAGDLNADLQVLGISALLGELGWSDLSQEATCFGSNSQTGRRIDVMIANPSLRARTLDLAVDWAAGFATHAAQVLKLRVGPCPSYRALVPSH